MITPDEVVAGITHMRDTLVCRDERIQWLESRLKECQQSIGTYQVTNHRLNAELTVAETELRERRAKFPA